MATFFLYSDIEKTKENSLTALCQTSSDFYRFINIILCLLKTLAT